MTSKLVLLRHGQSEWNKANRFTGWWDADLSEQGQAEATAAGPALADAGVLPTVLHTSLQTRAVRTAQLALDEIGRLWLPVRRSWRLNERHYGDLTGKDKLQIAEEHGTDQVKIWRRSYDIAPPPIAADNDYRVSHDPRYARLPEGTVPAAECLKDVVERMLPYWHDDIVSDLDAGHVVLVSAHGNSLRALVKHLERISDVDIAELNLPTGVPLLFDLGDDHMPLESKPITERFLGDVDAAKAAADAVAKQAG